MSSSAKGPEKQNPGKQSRAKNRDQNQDKYRWRKVAVWLIPIVFSVLLAVAVTAHGILAIWACVLTAITVVGYALFLLEWYVFKQNPARRRARVVCIVLCIAIAAIGITWQRKMPRPSHRFVVAVDMVMGSSKRDMNADYWFVIGDDAFPVHYALFLRAVNTGPPWMIESYTVEALNSKNAWVMLTRVPNLGEEFETFYFAYQGNLKEARKWEAVSFDPQIIDRVIPEHATVRGWAFFETPEDIDIEAGHSLRIHVKDVAGVESTQVVKAEEGTTLNKGSMLKIPMGMSRETKDFSTYRRRYWSENK